MKLRSVAILFALLLIGCAATPPLVSTERLQVVDATELPPPHGSSERPSAYVIGPFDRLIVDVLGFEELTAREVQVDAAGQISLPIAGTVQAAGRSPADVAREITERMQAGFVRSPQVSVNLDQSTSQFVTVEGEVTQPGNYPMVGNMTLMRAVAAARGPSDLAKLDDVVIFRTVEGQRMAALYNLAAIRRGAYDDPAVYPQDVVVVGDSPGRRMFQRIVEASTLITSPVIALVSSNAL